LGPPPSAALAARLRGQPDAEFGQPVRVLQHPVERRLLGVAQRVASAVADQRNIGTELGQGEIERGAQRRHARLCGSPRRLALLFTGPCSRHR
jgi:hypothetical protein